MDQDTEKKTTGFDQLRNMYNALDLNSKIIISGALVMIVVAILLLISFSVRPDYVLLYGGLDLKDASEIIQELDTQNIAYRVRSGGRDVYVPLPERDRLRITLAGKGFAPSATTGYELFDKNRMTLTSFQQQIDFKRALEGELARTLMSLEEVEFARVHLVIPEPTPFLEEQAESTASVVLKLRGAMQLKPARMAAISNLVAGAVPGMSADNVTVMDDKANLLAGGQLAESFDLHPLPNQQTYLKQFEETMKQKIKTLLEPAYGMGNVTVAVSAELDFDKVEEQSTEFEPMEGSDTGILRSQETTEISTRNSPTEGGGVAGATANLPTYQGTSGSQESSSRSDEASDIRNYEINEKQTKRTIAQGAVKRLSVSVLVNAEKLETDEQTSVESMVRDAVNFNQTRGDTITVAAMVFDTTFKEDVEKARAASTAASSRHQMVTYGVLILSAVLLGFLLFKLMRPVPHTVISAPTIDLNSLTSDTVDRDIFAVAGPDAAAAKLREEVVRIAKDNPEEAARVIKTWLKG